MLSVARLVSFWRCIPVQYNCQKSSNFQGLSHFSRIFGKNDKIPGFFQAGKTVTIFPGFPGAVGTLVIVFLASFQSFLSLIFFISLQNASYKIYTKKHRYLNYKIYVSTFNTLLWSGSHVFDLIQHRNNVDENNTRVRNCNDE